MDHEFESLPPQIDSISRQGNRPTWSIMIPVCNRLTYLRQALESVLVQDFGIEGMQICIVDNSTEEIDWGTWLKPAERERVEIVRQSQHCSLVENSNSCVRQARGDYVFLLHDDDWVAPTFFRTIQAAFESNPGVGAVFCRSFFTDEEGVILKVTPVLPDFLHACRTIGPLFPGNPIMTPSIVVRRLAYEQLGGFRPDLRYCTDWEMWCRVIATFGAIGLREVMAFYRTTGRNQTSQLVMSGENVRDMFRAFKYISRLDPDLCYETLRQYGRGTALEQAGYFWMNNREAAEANHAFFLELSTRTEKMRHYISRTAKRLTFQ